MAVEASQQRVRDNTGRLDGAQFSTLRGFVTNLARCEKI
jgi:hypothetical protein